MENGDLRIVVSFDRETSQRYAREAEPIEPVIVPVDLTTNTDQVKLAAVAMKKLSEALYERGYLASDQDGCKHRPSVKIEIFDAGEWITWHNPDGN